MTRITTPASGLTCLTRLLIRFQISVGQLTGQSLCKGSVAILDGFCVGFEGVVMFTDYRSSCFGGERGIDGLGLEEWWPSILK